MSRVLTTMRTTICSFNGNQADEYCFENFVHIIFPEVFLRK